MDHILIDYSNYIIKDNNQIDVVFYKTKDSIVVETTCTKQVCQYKGIKTFDSIQQARQFFDDHIASIIDDERISSFGTIDDQWYKKWDWIRIIDGRPSICIVETTAIECGNVNYQFNFDSKGNLNDDFAAMVVDNRFSFDKVGILSIVELASLKYGFQQRSIFDRFITERKIQKLYKLLAKHTFKLRKVNGEYRSSIMRDCQLIINGIINDILTYDSLELMMLNCSELIDDSKTFVIHQHHHR